MKNGIQAAPASRFHYGWIVAAVTFLTLLVAAGVRSAPGVLIVPLEQTFGWSRSETTSPLAVNLALYGLCGPFAAALMDRFGIRRVMLAALILLAAGTGLSAWMQAAWQFQVLWGLVVGLGSGLASSVLGAVVANRWFQQKRGVVIGVFTASGATGQLIFLPALADLAVSYTWRGAVLVTAAASLIAAVLAAVWMRNRPQDVGLLPYGAVEEAHVEGSPEGNPFRAALAGLRRGVTSKDFWLLAGSFYICGASTNGLIGTHLIPACVEHGIPEVTAAGMLAMIGVFDIVGTLMSGWLSDRLDNRWLLFWYYGLRGLSLFLLPYALEHAGWNMVLFMVFYGLDWVATVPPTVRLTSDRFGAQSGVVYGWITASHQLGAATAAFGGGYLHSLMGDYQLTFLIAGALCLCASGFVAGIRKKRQAAALA